MILPVITALIAAAIWWIFGHRPSKLDGLPGEKTTLWQRYQQSKHLNPLKWHVSLAEKRRKYGTVFKLEELARPSMVFVCDHDAMYQVLVKQGKEFGGRPFSYKMDAVLGGSGILFSTKPDATWKALRNISQRHLRQFGDGLSRLESVIGEISEDMFEEFDKNEAKAYDPQQMIFDTALNNIAFLITGKRTRSGDTIVEEMREYEDLLLKTNPHAAPITFRLLNFFPMLRHLHFDKWKPFQRFLYLQKKIWAEVTEMHVQDPELNSICKLLLKHLSNQDSVIKEIDAEATALSLLFAGVTTTSATFYGTVNMLAHRPDVQDKLLNEINKVSGPKIKLSDRGDMPYARAVLFEMLRYFSPVPLGVAHKTMQKVELNGHEIPEGITVFCNIWDMHHNENFWKDPFEFIPERFLDDDGSVVPVDHPNRKHLMPFGAGARVCVGEALAMARLFLWLTTLVSRYRVSPAPGNEKSSTDTRDYIQIGVLKPPPYKVIFTKRE